MNPVLNKEFKLRFRSGKSFLGVLFYILAFSIFIIGFISLVMVASGQRFFKPEESRTMFMILSYLQLGLILFITPGLTGGVISSERERQTLNILLTTTQSSTNIIIGKLVSSLSYLVLLMLASLPLYSFVFLFGGISPGQVLMTLGFFIFTILVYGSLGVLFSTLIRKTIVSMVTSYSMTLFLAGGTAILTLILMQLTQGFSGTQVTSPFPYFTAMLNPPMIMTMLLQPEFSEEFVRLTGIHFPVWLAYLVSYTLIFAAALLISIRKLRPIMKAKKI